MTIIKLPPVVSRVKDDRYEEEERKSKDKMYVHYNTTQLLGEL